MPSDLPRWLTWPERHPAIAAVVTKVCLVALVIVVVLIGIALTG